MQMPWKETSPVLERKKFVEEYERGVYSVAELCRRFGISRKTGYKWLKRFDEGGAAELADRGRRPRRSPNAVDPRIAAALLSARKQRPTWGPKKLRAVLAASNPSLKLPSVSTIASLFKRNGLVRPRRKRHRTPPYTSPLGHATRPNALWCIDFKGHFAVGTTRCYPLTVTDAFSRFIIACVALTSTTTTAVRRALERIFDEFGLPDAIRSDNGSPFASRGVAGLSRLSVWWWRLGIRHERIEPGQPQQNGRHERMHLTLQAETASPPARILSAQQQRFDRFRHVFNTERPHEALGQVPPSKLYEPSRRRLPNPPWGRDIEYLPHLDVVRVSKLGYVRSPIGAVFISTALVHERLGLNVLSNRRCEVFFGQVRLGHIERSWGRRRTIRFVTDPNLSPMSSERGESQSSR
jgi:putative transposase